MYINIVALLLTVLASSMAEGPYPGYSAPYPPAVSSPYAPAAPISGPDPGLIGGPGLVGGAGFGGPIPPPVPFFGAFPPPDPALYGLSPSCAKFELIKAQVVGLLEPVFVGFLGVVAFLLVRSLVLPYLGHFAKIMEARSNGEELNHLDAMSATILKAISKGVCLERVVCQMGIKAKNYTLTNAVVRAIEESSEEPQRLIAVFRDAASGKEDNCKRFSCRQSHVAELSRSRKRISHNKVR